MGPIGGKRRWLALSLLAAGAIVVFLAWAVWLEPRRLVSRRIDVPLAGLSEHHDGLRITVLTDLHVGSPHQHIVKLTQIVAAANAQQSDVTLLLGDLVIQGVLGGTFVSPEDIAGALRNLRATHGVFAVLGNHDWWLDGPRVQAALVRAGIRVLEDDAASVLVNGEPIWFAGVSDFWERPHDVDRALRRVPSNDPVVVFTHNPDIFPDVPARVTLTVAGHTHGGQVRLPFIGRPIVPSRFGERYAAGLVVEDGRSLFVSTGLGTSIIPVRFRVPPEVVQLILRRQEVE
jgi:predicted MPP superfamily phosphohydrolase